ncbi:MAG: VOC family protein [Nocardioides sp.]|uniref:VOC family protein n=1 Tax=Nocardioides sp. TaxID=35761 RepID=UPI003D6C0D57
MYAGIVSPDGKDESGGMYPSETPVAPLPLIRTSDLEAAVAAVEKAGGTIAEPPYDYPGGRRFIFTDPAGNRLGVYQPTE